MGGKRKVNLQIDCEEVSEMEKSIFSEIGSDGLRFLRQDILISTEGIMKISGEPLPWLLPTSKERVSSEGELGRGSACVVERGVYLPLGVPVAIKVHSN